MQSWNPYTTYCFSSVESILYEYWIFIRIIKYMRSHYFDETFIKDYVHEKNRVKQRIIKCKRSNFSFFNYVIILLSVRCELVKVGLHIF